MRKIILIIALIFSLSACTDTEQTKQSLQPSVSSIESTSPIVPSQDIEKTSPRNSDTPVVNSTPAVNEASKPVTDSTPKPVVNDVPKPTVNQAEKQEVTVYITKTGEKYHRSGCRYLSKSKIPTSLSDAKKYYTPCSVCNPPQ